MTGHPDDDVTDAEREYNAAFVQWFRTRSDIDERRRETLFERMIVDSARRSVEEKAA